MEQQNADDGDESTGGARAPRPELAPRLSPDDCARDADPRPSPREYIGDVTDLALADPVSAGDHAGDLLAIVHDHDDEDVCDAAGEALNLIGLVRPVEFEVWVGDVVALAECADDDRAFIGLRALAQLAAKNPQAAAHGLDVAFSHVGAPRPELRQAALSVVAEVGSATPGRVRRADRHVATALADPNAGIRLTGSIAAGKLLGAAPTQFPRTANALFDVLDDPVDEVWEFAHVALVHFARQHPLQVPHKSRSIEILARVSDAEIGVREGSTKAALSALLAAERGFDL